MKLGKRKKSLQLRSVAGYFMGPFAELESD